MRLVVFAPWFSLLYTDDEAELDSGAGQIPGALLSVAGMGLLLSPAQLGLVRTKLVAVVGALLLRPGRAAAGHFAGQAAVAGGMVLPALRAPAASPAGWPSRAKDAYETKGKRVEVFAPVIALLPADATTLGFSAADFPETSLWKPFGSRRILHVKLSDSAEEVRKRGIKYLSGNNGWFEEPWPEWLQRMEAREFQKVTLKMWGSLPPFVWHLVELNPRGTGQEHPKPEPNHRHDS